MTPYDFPGANIRLGEGQPEYQVLPAVATTDGQIVTCWRPTFWEAVKLLFTRRVWVHTLTHGRPFQPLILSAHQLVTMPDENDPNAPMVPIPQVGE